MCVTVRSLMTCTGDGTRETRSVFPFAIQRWKKGNEILGALWFPEMEEGKYDPYFPLLSGDGRKETRSLFPFVYRRWKKGNKILTSFGFPEMEKGK